MKKTLLLSALTLASAMLAVSCKPKAGETASTTPIATEQGTAQPGQIVYFNMDKVMEGYDMAHDLLSVLETKTSGIQAEIDRRGKKLEKDAADFQSKVDKGLLTTSVAQVQYQKLQQQQAEYQQYVLRKQQEMNEEQQVTMNQIADAISNFAIEYNATHNYAMILASSGTVISAPVVTADPSLDITDDLLSGLNAAYIKSKDNKKK